MKESDIPSIPNTIMELLAEKAAMPFCEGRWAATDHMLELMSRKMEISRQMNAEGWCLVQAPSYKADPVSSCPIYNNEMHGQKAALLAGDGWLDGPLSFCNGCPMRAAIRQKLTGLGGDPQSPALVLGKIDSVLQGYNRLQHLKMDRLVVNDFRLDGAISLSYATAFPRTRRHEDRVRKKLAPMFHKAFGHDAPVVFSKPLCSIPHVEGKAPEPLITALSGLNARLDARIEVTSFDGHLIHVRVPLDSREAFQEEMELRAWLSMYFGFNLKMEVEVVLERPYPPFFPKKGHRYPDGVCD